MADHASIYQLAETVVASLAQAGSTVATAESCTGGWIAKSLTDVAGSSAVFGYGLVSYSNPAKEKLLGVDEATLARLGAVSDAVVREMAAGVINLSGADIAVAVSGVAGPDGGTPEKPVGTVWFAWAIRVDGQARIDTDCQQFAGDRERVRELTVSHALQGILERVPEAR